MANFTDYPSIPSECYGVDEGVTVCTCGCFPAHVEVNIEHTTWNPRDAILPGLLRDFIFHSV